MDCPVDGTTLLMSERSGVEIDYCPKCRGVWLDRGELDKIIDRVEPDDDRPARAVPAPPPVSHEYRPPAYGGEPRYDKKRKRKGLLGEMFDFD